MRKVVVVAAVVATVVTPVVAHAVMGRGSSGPAPLSANAQRFLQLSGADRSATAGTSSQGSASSASGVGAGGRQSCGSEPTTPAGWCLTPAGNQFDVLRFPIGLEVDPTSAMPSCPRIAAAPKRLLSWIRPGRRRPR